MPAYRTDVLHVPYTYFPDTAGGTEFYVAALGAELARCGISSAVAAPGATNTSYRRNGMAVYRFAGEAVANFARAYGEPDVAAARSFRSILKEVQPRIVHLHAHTSAVSHLLADAAHENGAEVFSTYHTATVSCTRETMMKFGRDPCDGLLNARVCTQCTLAKHNVPLWTGRLLAEVPRAFGYALGRVGVSGGVFTALRMPTLVADAHERLRTFWRKADRIIAVCQWVAELLVTNGVDREKVVLCRQGLFRPSIRAARIGRARDKSEPLRLGYFGRLEPAKGADLIVEALTRIPDAPVQLDIFGIRQPGTEDYVRHLAAAADRRVRFHEPVTGSAVLEAMAECDLVTVPSRCLETGPLVVYEAFAAGTPVLGSGLGGIAELVRDDVDGILVPRPEVRAWARIIASTASDRDSVQRLREGVRAPRTMRDAATEMMNIYGLAPA